MNKCIFLIGFHILLASIFCYSYSQDTVKFWNITYYDEDFSPDHQNPTWTYYGLKTGADTSIDEILYKKLLQSNDSLFTETSTIGGVREDSNRIYLSRSRYSMEEVLLYDFNLNNDDTVMVYRLIRINNFTGYETIVRVDSVNTIDISGDDRKQLFVEYQCIGYPEYNDKDIWVEGIGSINNGFLNESCMCLTGCYTKSHLTCFYENDLLKWTNSNFNNCVIDSSGIVQSIEENGQHVLSFSINPNPIIDISRISYSEDFEFAKIYDLMGRHVKTYRFNDEYLEISKSDFKSGLYMIVVTLKDKSVYSQKLIVK